MLTILETSSRLFTGADRPNGAGRLRRFYLVQCGCGSKPFDLQASTYRPDGQCRSCYNTDGLVERVEREEIDLLLAAQTRLADLRGGRGR